MNATKYEGWGIEVRYFLSALGDVDPVAYEETYAQMIADKFPGATIDVTGVADGVGHTVRLHTPFTLDYERNQAITEEIENLGERAWDECCDPS